MDGGLGMGIVCFGGMEIENLERKLSFWVLDVIGTTFYLYHGLIMVDAWLRGRAECFKSCIDHDEGEDGYNEFTGRDYCVLGGYTESGNGIVLSITGVFLS